VPLRSPQVPGHDARTQAVSPPADPVIEHVAETGSTNSDLLARVHAAEAEQAAAFAPSLLVADRQTAGRGRHGRHWHGAAGASLTFSLAWPFARADLSGLSLAVGVALADALEPPPRSRIGLKWPNDLWLLDSASGPLSPPGRKLAGVLVETVPFAPGRVAVVGVGINIAAQDVADAASGVAALVEIDAAATPAAALQRVAPALIAAMRRFESAGFAAFADRFAARDLLRGRQVVGDAEGAALEGVASGVDADGSLLLDGPNGRMQVTSGEWRLRLAEATGSPC
jgi:BirA family transcriptional regulator, biotin operon repressor / biotin---[acetyl-CoA-carboxylase] ligase